jgi:hypothetical protein
VLAVAVVALTAAAPARAAETIGSSLAATPDTPLTCTVECTVVQDGAISPIQGVIVRWRVKTGTGPATPMRLEVLNGALATTGGPVLPLAGATTTFTTRMPIEVGNAIALLCCVDDPTIVRAGSGTIHVFDPPGNVMPTDVAGELLLNADVEPDADHDVFGDETQDNCVGVANPDQANRDHDAVGDACDACPDSAGTAANGCPVVASPPNQPPTARFRTPLTGSAVGPRVRIELDAADDSGPPNVSVFDDDGTICVLRAAPYACTWTPTGADVGRATLLASAVDAGGLSSLAIVRVRVSRFAATLTKKAKRRKGRTTITGKLVLPGVVTRAQGCSGKVTVKIKKARKTVPLTSRCAYTAVLRVRTGKPRVTFAGNPVIAPT